VELLNKLYHLQYRRSLDSWFVDGGYLSKPLNEVQVVLAEAMDGKDEVMERYLASFERKLYLNNMQSEVEIIVEPSVEPDVKVSSNDYQKRTLDILIEVKQTRVCIKKVQQLFNDLKESMEVPKCIMKMVLLMIADW
jgi:hypothetical protein